MESEENDMKDEEKLIADALATWECGKAELDVMQRYVDLRKKEVVVHLTILDQHVRDYTVKLVSKLKNPVIIKVRKFEECDVAFFSQESFEKFLVRFKQDKALHENFKFTVYSQPYRSGYHIAFFVDRFLSVMGLGYLKKIDDTDSIVDFIYRRLGVTSKIDKVDYIEPLLNGGVYKQDVVDRFNKSSMA